MLRHVQKIKVHLLCIIMVLFAMVLNAENVQINSITEKYYEALQLTGDAEANSNAFAALSTNEWSLRTSEHPWKEWGLDEEETDPFFQPLNQRLLSSYNSYYPSGHNDFEAWQGAGFNIWADGGVLLSFDELITVTLAPRVSFSENRKYSRKDSVVGEYGYFVGGIDWPQRFGDDAYYQITPGESEVRGHYKQLSLGIGTQSVWMGPTQYNPLILGNNSGGFPHVDLSLSPVQTWIGEIEFTAMWGYLSESNFFDGNSKNDHRYCAFLGISYVPEIIPGLTLGVNRFTQSPMREFTVLNAFDPFTTQMSSALGKDNKDQRASLTADWIFPRVGFEAYVEWARNDYSPNWRYIVRAPEHSSAYTLGFRQSIPTHNQDTHLILNAELTDLIQSRDYAIDFGTTSTGGFYHHGINRQGHTHNGQLLAAGIGSGADSQTLGLDWFFRRGMVGGKIVRTSRNKNYVYNQPDAGEDDIKRMNVEMLYEVSGAYWWSKNVLLELAVSYARNINWKYEEKNDVNNVRVYLGITYNP